MKNSIKALSALSLLAALAAPATSQAAANLVVNGSFELGSLGIGSFTGWNTVLGDLSTFVDSSGQTGLLAGEASNGLWSAYFGSTAANGGATISQSLATTAGQSYFLSFDLANDNGGDPAANSFMADIDGQQVFGASNLGDQGYVHESVEFTATTGSTLLAFGGFNDNSYLQLDNVSVTVVPEPGAAELWLVGLMTIAAWRAARRPGVKADRLA